ncbi:TonB family protein [Pendulispora rubella]|uniref:TonB family protein n=1 Tax=Pendulispora rubella TaxID=2741070 RepID=A0ABZ2LI38_9BACT
MGSKAMKLLGVAAWTFASLAHAHDVDAPKLKTQTPGAWPGGHAESHDVLVPVTLTVSVAGTVQGVVVEEGISSEFDRAAIAAASTWTYEPARRNGQPVAARVRAAVRFTSAPAEKPAPQASAPEPPPAPANAAVQVRGTPPPRSASATVRGRDVIELAPHRTASDLLQLAPGIFVTQHSGEGKAHQIFLRGFDAVHGQDLEIWVGGIPVNEVSNIHGQGYADLHFAMPEVIKEIQATPGTYDPRQGDFAVAGSIRMRLGYAEPGITATGTLGSFGTKRLFLAYHPPGTSDETFAAFEEYSTDGFGPNRAARRGSFIAQATHDFGKGFEGRVLATTYTGRFDSAGVVRLDDIQNGTLDKYGFYDPKQGGYSSRTQVLAELRQEGENSHFSVAPFVAFRSLTLRQNFTGYLVDSQRGGAARNDSDNTQQIHEDIMVGATASYRRTVKLLSSRDALEAGFYGRTDFIEQSQRRLSDVNDLPTETLVDAKVRGTNVAGYLDASLFPIRRLALRGGIRADALSYSTQDRVPPASDPTATASQARAAQGAHFGKKATADLLLVPGLHALASYGEGFRSPQARSLSEGERTPFAEVTSYEVGIRYADGNRFQGSLAAFHTRLSEDLAFDQTTARNERVPGTQRTGVAAELTARADWLTTSASVTYTRASFTGSDAQYKEGDLLPYVPQIVGRVDIGAKRRLARVFGRDLEGRIGSSLESLFRRPLPYSEFGHDVFLVDARAALRLKEVELGLDAFNLLDAFWYDGEFVYASNFNRGKPAQLVPFRHVTVGAPRSVFLSLTLHI